MDINKIESVFTDIYKNNTWQSSESASGVGSEILSTLELRERLPILFENYEIKSLLDIGCGDFNWMKTIVHKVDKYVGVDTVKELVVSNIKLYSSTSISFLHRNIIDLDWEFYNKFDAIIIKDVLCHLTYENSIKILTQIKLSKAKYLFVTSNLSVTKNQKGEDGGWRPINLIISPYNLGIPTETIVSYSDSYFIGDNYYYDKTLSMWRTGTPQTGKHNGFVNDIVKKQLDAINPHTIVDVGTGDGYWGKVCRLMFPNAILTGIELSAKWFDHCHTLSVYDILVHEDIKTAINGTVGDVIIFGDILEHLEKDNALEVIVRAVDRFKWVIINTPVGFQSQEVDGDPEETHRCGLTRDDLSEFNIVGYSEGKEIEQEYLVFNCLIKGNGR